MKKILIFMILTFLLSLSVKADDGYVTQYNNVGADKINEGLTEQTREFFKTVQNKYELLNLSFIG